MSPFPFIMILFFFLFFLTKPWVFENKIHWCLKFFSFYKISPCEEDRFQNNRKLTLKHVFPLPYCILTFPLGKCYFSFEKCSLADFLVRNITMLMPFLRVNTHYSPKSSHYMPPNWQTLMLFSSLILVELPKVFELTDYALLVILSCLGFHCTDPFFSIFCSYWCFFSHPSLFLWCPWGS